MHFSFLLFMVNKDDETKAMTVGGVGGRFLFVFVLSSWDREALNNTISGLFEIGSRGVNCVLAPEWYTSCFVVYCYWLLVTCLLALSHNTKCIRTNIELTPTPI